MSNVAPISAALDAATVITDDWPAPDMTILRGGRSTAPAMPAALFGSTWDLIKDLADGAGSPVDYVAMAVVAVAGSMVGNRRRVRPYQTSLWNEPCIPWIALVGDPATNKSPGLDAATSPINRMELDQATAFDGLLKDFETKAERARAERKVWEAQVKEAVKDRHDTPDIPDAAMTPERPERPRLMVQDATPESVGAILAANSNGVLMLRDELAGWFQGFDRYSPGGREFWLEAYGGRPHIIDRKSHQNGPLRIAYNGVTVLGGIQPEKLADSLLAGADDGLVPRFLWVWPDPVPYHRPKSIADIDRLERIYRRLNGLRPGINPKTHEPEPVILMLDDKAGDIFEKWSADLQRDVGEAASLFKSFCGKLKGMALRLALVSELLKWADSSVASDPQTVSWETIGDAIEFLETYAKPTALRVFGDAALPAVERNAAALARYILNERLSLFNPREHRDRCRIPDMKDATKGSEAVAALVDADWLKPMPTRTGGRPRKDFAVNPAIYSGIEQ